MVLPTGTLPRPRIMNVSGVVVSPTDLLLVSSAFANLPVIRWLLLLLLLKTLSFILDSFPAVTLVVSPRGHGRLMVMVGGMPVMKTRPFPVPRRPMMAIRFLALPLRTHHCLRWLYVQTVRRVVVVVLALLQRFSVRPRRFGMLRLRRFAAVSVWPTAMREKTK